MKPLNLITGGSGFIGRFIAYNLLAKGERVRILDLLSPDIDSDNIEYIKADIRDRDTVIEACRDVKHLYHIVALVPLSKAGKRFWDVNVGGTRNVLDGALQFGIKKVVHMSTSAVYNLDHPSPMDESSPIEPMVEYGRSKYEGEKVCDEYRAKGLDITIVRPRTVVGPERMGIFGILFDWINRGKNIFIIGKGDNKIQFVHVKELAEACVRMANKPGNDHFNIGTDRFSTLREDLEALIRHSGKNVKVRSLPAGMTISILHILDKLRLSPLADWHYLTYHRDFYFDVSKAKEKLGWQPHYSNAESLIDAYDWYIKHKDEAERSVGTTHRKSVSQKVLALLRRFS